MKSHRFMGSGKAQCKFYLQKVMGKQLFNGNSELNTGNQHWPALAIGNDIKSIGSEADIFTWVETVVHGWVKSLRIKYKIMTMLAADSNLILKNAAVEIGIHQITKCRFSRKDLNMFQYKLKMHQKINEMKKLRGSILLIIIIMSLKWFIFLKSNCVLCWVQFLVVGNCAQAEFWIWGSERLK